LEAIFSTRLLTKLYVLDVEHVLWLVRLVH